MSVCKFKFFLVLSSLLAVNCLDLLKLNDECLKGKPSQFSLECITTKGVRVQRIQEGTQKFYCVNYEKKTGNANEFHTLGFNLTLDDYELKFVSNY